MPKTDKLRWFFGIIALCWSAGAWAQQGVESTAAAGIAGVNSVDQGNEVQIYAVELLDNTNDARSARIGGVPVVGEGIIITISDLTAATGVVAGDFTGLNVYRSTDGVFDGGDTFLKAVAPVNIGATTVVDFQGVANPTKTLPDPGDVPDRIYFLITADIAAGATAGHAFRLGAAVNHIDMRDSGGGAPLDYNIGSAIVAADGNRVVITAANTGGTGTGIASAGGSSVEQVSAASHIPFGGEWVFALLGVAYGVYALYRRQ